MRRGCFRLRRAGRSPGVKRSARLRREGVRGGGRPLIRPSGTFSPRRRGRSATPPSGPPQHDHDQPGQGQKPAAAAFPGPRAGHPVRRGRRSHQMREDPAWPRGRPPDGRTGPMDREARLEEVLAPGIGERVGAPRRGWIRRAAIVLQRLVESDDEPRRGRTCRRNYAGGRARACACPSTSSPSERGPESRMGTLR